MIRMNLQSFLEVSIYHFPKGRSGRYCVSRFERKLQKIHIELALSPEGKTNNKKSSILDFEEYLCRV